MRGGAEASVIRTESPIREDRKRRRRDQGVNG
jgi:hypothetical protein